MPGYDHLFGGSSSSSSSSSSSPSNSPGHPGNANYNHGTGQSGSSTSSNVVVNSNVNDDRGIHSVKPRMETGFGSWFGANSGSTGSSELVQTTIQDAILKALADKEKLHREGKVKDAQGNIIPWQASMHNQTVTDVMDNLYPSKDKHGNPFKTLSEEEWLEIAGADINNPNEMNALLDYNIASLYGGYSGASGSNLMGIPPGQTPIESSFFKNVPSLGGPGGGITYSGYGGDDTAAYYSSGLGGTPKQLGDSEYIPGQSEMLDYMIRVNKFNPYTKKALAKDGGIISLIGG